MASEARFFVSYAARDAQAAAALLERLRAQLAASARFRYRLWDFRQLLLGERWHARIQEEVAACDFGLLLVSPAFLASEYIGAHELPRFVGPHGKPMLPVGLKPVDFARHDLKGLGAHQVFRHDGRFFLELGGPRRDAFALALFQQIEDRLERHAAPVARS